MRLSLILLLLALSGCANVTGVVIYVSDGDTITVLDDTRTQHKIRLAGIDAPEMGQPFGQRAKQYMSDLVYSKEVYLEGDKQDRYGRTIAKVWVTPASCPKCSKTLDAGMAMLTVGLAWHYKHYQKEQTEEDRAQYSFAEYKAKAKRAGLWADPDPTPPWDWRKAKRNQLTEKRRGASSLMPPLYSTSLTLCFSMDRQPAAPCERVSVVVNPIRL